VISHLHGRLAHLDPSGPSVELDVGGVTYEVLVPAVLWPEIQELAGDADLAEPAARPEIGLHVFYHATANQPVPVLVGFLRRPERDFFRKFTTVEGIGPVKAAKAITVSVSTIARAIEQEDRATLTRLPGIGTRAADKIIATLRGRVVAEAAMRDAGVAQPVDPSRFEQRRMVADAVEAVAALGYPRSEARRWVQDALAAEPSLDTVEDVTLAVLRGRGARQGPTG
jgi:Holliday junction DNA helicase RuvA